MKKIKVIMDCDPGIDDALALAYAAANRDTFELLGITTVAGNQTIEKVTGNALKLTEFYGLDVPVAQGMSTPLLREIQTAPEVHGPTGLGYCELPETSRKPVEENAILFMYKTIMALPENEKVTLIPTGPLTNVALLLKLFPEVKDKIDQIIFMGGAACGGNVTACAEFNIYVDPEAAKIVFKSGIPMVMCGLDATMKCNLTSRQIAKLNQTDDVLAKACGQMTAFSLDSSFNKYRNVVSIHDVVPFMYLAHPEIFKAERAILDVDCSEGVSRGKTICDFRWWGYDSEDVNSFVLMNADSEKFQEYLITAIFELGAELGMSKGN